MAGEKKDMNNSFQILMMASCGVLSVCKHVFFMIRALKFKAYAYLTCLFTELTGMGLHCHVHCLFVIVDWNTFGLMFFTLSDAIKLLSGNQSIGYVNFNQFSLR